MILNDASLFEMWKGDIVVMAQRIIAMRKELVELLEKKGTPGSWTHITEQIGMFRWVIMCVSVPLDADMEVVSLGLDRRNASYLLTKHIST
jgi:aspartate/tyrosine/aromatic aminotransferase